jgi:hypothetical protein
LCRLFGHSSRRLGLVVDELKLYKAGEISWPWFGVKVVIGLRLG